MYLSHLPSIIPNWEIVENDEEYHYLELSGYSGEFRIYLTEDRYENPDKPYKLGFDQTKGILERFDYSTLEADSLYSTPKEAVQEMMEVIKSITDLYNEFLPVTNEVFLALGDARHFDSIQNILGGETKIADYKGQSLVFRKVSLTWGSLSYEDAAIKSIKFLTEQSPFQTDDFSDCFLCNEKFDWIGGIELGTLKHESHS
ncbi:hypothetical protein [Algoriphagus aquimarinus]|uniref:Uncharacterized protein n=1 Tax=Algoriphagus aquimarinus TaxID=237018 RepID=A0A5C7ARL5_9BACT|nr:hypothetical protein [Algoriphagus aquimarinus]TXE11406.1 hypothetical protein ESV85_10810 [Algoriphagus aquimarinus]